MVEGYLQDKWKVDNGIVQADHKYKDSAPDFSERSTRRQANTLLRHQDGGTDTGAWDNEVELGNYLGQSSQEGFLWLWICTQS